LFAAIAVFLTACGDVDKNISAAKVEEDTITVVKAPVENVETIFNLKQCATTDFSDSKKITTQLNPDESQNAFEATLYPYLRSINCSSCHAVGGIGPVKHSDSDPAVAHASALGAISIARPGDSRIVERMIIDRHQCGNNCELWGNDIKEKIEDWVAQSSIQQDATEVYNFQSVPATLAELESTVKIYKKYTIEAESGALGYYKGTEGVRIAVDETASETKVYEINGPLAAPFGGTGGHLSFNGVVEGKYSVSIKYKAEIESTFFYTVNSKIQQMNKLSPTSDWKIVNVGPLHDIKSNFKFTIYGRTVGLRIDQVYLNFEEKSGKTRIVKFPLDSFLEKDCGLYFFLGEGTAGCNYEFHEPFLSCKSDENLYLRGINLLINGELAFSGNNYSDYENNLRIDEPKGTIAIKKRSSMLVPLVQGIDKDKFSIAFDDISLGHKTLENEDSVVVDAPVADVDFENSSSRHNAFRTLLYNKCMSCHGFDSPSGDAAFTIDYSPEDYVNFSYTRTAFNLGRGSGDPTTIKIPNSKLIVPGDLENSRIWKRVTAPVNITYEGTTTFRPVGYTRMPRNSFLNEEEKEIIKQFILRYGQ